MPVRWTLWESIHGAWLHVHDDNAALGVRIATRLALPPKGGGRKRRSDGRPISRVRGGRQKVPVRIQQASRVSERVEEVKPALRPRMVANQAVRAPSVRLGDLAGGVSLRYQGVAVAGIIYRL